MYHPPSGGALDRRFSFIEARPGRPDRSFLVSQSSDAQDGPTGTPQTTGSTGARDHGVGASPSDSPVDPGDERFMQLALDEARRAEELDEVPIGTVIVRDGEILARAHNQVRALSDPTAHAEILAVRAATAASGDIRLVGTTVYTTVEPCFMCAGALVHARVRRVVWAVRDPKFGGCRSLGQVLTHPDANHRVEITEGVCAEASRDLLRSFFQSKRNAHS